MITPLVLVGREEWPPAPVPPICTRDVFLTGRRMTLTQLARYLFRQSEDVLSMVFMM